MENNIWWISIVVAIIGVIGSLIRTNIELKKDSKTTGIIKADTSEIKPKIANTEQDTRRIKEVIVEEIAPRFRGNNTFIDKIDIIASDVEFRKRLEDQTIRNGIDTQEVVASINAMETIIRNQENQIRDLRRENIELKSTNIEITKENEELQSKLDEYQHKRFRGMEL